MKNVSKSWKKDLKKRAAFALAASIVLALTSCKPQKQAIIRQQAIPVPVLKIDTAFAFNRDTTFVFETDTFFIETVIRDTLISQHIETKPFFITRIDTIRDDNSQETEQQLKKENKELKKKERMVALSFLVLSLVLILSLIKKNK